MPHLQLPQAQKLTDLRFEDHINFGSMISLFAKCVDLLGNIVDLLHKLIHPLRIRSGRVGKVDNLMLQLMATFQQGDQSSVTLLRHGYVHNLMLSVCYNKLRLCISI